MIETSTFEQMAMFIAAAQTGVVLFLSVLLIVRYARHRSMGHIAVVAISYIILTALTSGAIIYRIFLQGPSRTISIIAALIAFALGDFALWKVWHRRGKSSFESFAMRISTNEQRLEKLEAKLEMFPGTEGEPIHVKVVDGESNDGQTV